MTPDQSTPVPPGWVGGFAESDPAFAYPDPDLTSLPLLENMANIDLLDRQQAVLWPEFSWETVPGTPDSRAFQMFAPDISRVGYTSTGRVYSVICPQQGTCSPSFGTLNIEVSVTGQRGWVDEPSRTVAADLTVEGKIWFSPSAVQSPLVQLLWDFFSTTGRPFPADKEHAIRVPIHRHGEPSEPVLPGRSGQTDWFPIPPFAQHHDTAWAVANLAAEIAPVALTDDDLVDDFNELVMYVFNLSSGNLLAPGNLLTWNVWFTEPALVDRVEWREHAEKWRTSIDACHGPEGSQPRYFDGRPFKPDLAAVASEQTAIAAFIEKHVPAT